MGNDAVDVTDADVEAARETLASTRPKREADKPAGKRGRKGSDAPQT